jgi:hypothetical protein
MTGEVIRASCSTALRYERARPGELVHIDVKKLGRTAPDFRNSPEAINEIPQLTDR